MTDKVLVYRVTEAIFRSQMPGEMSISLDIDLGYVSDELDKDGNAIFKPLKSMAYTLTGPEILAFLNKQANNEVSRFEDMTAALGEILVAGKVIEGNLIL